MEEFYKSIKLYNDFLDAKTFSEAQSYLRKHNWGLQSSSSPLSPQKFLIMFLHEYELFNKFIFSKIEEATETRFELMRVYANGQFYGMPGEPHYDEYKKDFYTFLIYMNNKWDIIWGGQTIFLNSVFDPDLNKEVVKEEIFVQYPKRNLGIMFPSNLLHFAESPTRICTEFRTTIAFKLRKI